MKNSNWLSGQASTSWADLIGPLTPSAQNTKKKKEKKVAFAWSHPQPFEIEENRTQLQKKRKNCLPSAEQNLMEPLFKVYHS